ncbi:hypothetical protein UlMin_045326 [Ulmus minor]
MDFDPPFHETYKTLFQNSLDLADDKLSCTNTVEKFELPMINLNHLNSKSQQKREKCMHEIVKAASNWGFFQVVNHGIPEEILKNISYEQKKLFHQPFKKKVENNFLNLPANSYRWGNPKANSLRQLNWSEAFHLSVTDITRINECRSLRLTMERFEQTARTLVKTLAEVLAQNLGFRVSYFQENCPPSTSYLRLNRYPPTPHPSKVFGLIPHTDSDFLSMVYQDQVGGLQLLKDGRWFAVKPNPQALIINIGDLFQALSNGVYKSIKHRVVGSSEVERFSAAYFYCPSTDAMIESCSQLPALYRQFSFREYQRQNEKDVKDTGDKVGLQRFLL